MDAHKRTLEEILSPSIRLTAPLFQRPYVWNEESNWVPLWRALEDQCDRREQGNARPYFLGALVLDQTPMPVGSAVANQREIIDGQQRLTTLQILFRAAMDVLEEYGLTHEAGQLRGLVFNNLKAQTDERFKVWPTNVDRDRYRAVMEGRPGEGLMANAHSFFRQRLVERFADETSRERRAEILLETVTRGLVFAAIDLDKNDDSQLIFETLNSMGTPLLPSDLVKNLLFRQALAQGLDTDELYRRYWAPFESDARYWRAEIAGRNRTRLDVFLQHYLGLVLAREPLVTGLFRAYGDRFADGGFGAVENALGQLAHHAALYRAFDEREGEGAEASLRDLLRWTNTTTLLPVVLGILARVSDDDERSRMFSTLESYLGRRFVCNLQAKGQNKFGYDLVAHLHASGWTNDHLKAILLAQGGVTYAWPHDGWVSDAVRWKPAYTAIARARLAYLLIRLERDLRGGKTERTTGPHPDEVTIEHLMPQNWREHWPLAEEATEEEIRARTDAVQRFGNLTVVVGKLNSSLSNGMWSEKRKGLNRNSVLLMNNRLAEHETWGEPEIARRGEEIAAAFCRIWPRD